MRHGTAPSWVQSWVQSQPFVHRGARRSSQRSLRTCGDVKRRVRHEGGELERTSRRARILQFTLVMAYIASCLRLRAGLVSIRRAV